MPEESLTLYKLMILFMLDHLDFPLTNSQLCEFFINRNYASYFQLQQALNELSDTKFLQSDRIRNTTRYTITPSGQEALRLFQSKIAKSIQEEILDYFKEHKFKLRREINVTADYYPLKSGEYMVEAFIKERGVTLMDIKLNVVSKEQAIAVCDNWSERSDAVYARVMETLLLDEDQP